jgi:prepilin-type N-terminal cleavage/methylation domain-containing protein
MQTKKDLKNYINKQKAFSLVELLVVVAIIGVLSSVGVVGYQQYTETTKTKVLIQQYNQVRKAIDFELIVAQNGLQTAIKELNEDFDMVDEDRNVTTNSGEQRFIDADTTCNNFLHSMKKHFENDGAQATGQNASSFKNPWNTNWETITIDTNTMRKHRQGQIQLVCNNQTGDFGHGAGCPIGSDAVRMSVVVFLKDRGRFFDQTSPHDCDGTFLWGNNETAVSDESDCVWRMFIGGAKRASQADAEADCGWDQSVHGPFNIKTASTTAIRSESGGECSGTWGNCE